jgi:hypothetical protein
MRIKIDSESLEQPWEGWIEEVGLEDLPEHTRLRIQRLRVGEVIRIPLEEIFVFERVG